LDKSKCGLDKSKCGLGTSKCGLDTSKWSFSYWNISHCKSRGKNQQGAIV
jgi:hypothetical protein